MKKIPKFLFFYKWTYSVQLKPEQGTRQFVFTSWQWQGIKVSATTRQILASKSLDNVFRDNATAKWNISRFFAPSSFGPLSCPLAGSQFMSVLVGGGGGGQLHPLTLCLLPHSTLIRSAQNSTFCLAKTSTILNINDAHSSYVIRNSWNYQHFYRILSLSNTFTPGPAASCTFSLSLFPQ